MFVQDLPRARHLTARPRCGLKVTRPALGGFEPLRPAAVHEAGTQGLSCRHCRTGLGDDSGR